MWGEWEEWEELLQKKSLSFEWHPLFSLQTPDEYEGVSAQCVSSMIANPKCVESTGSESCLVRHHSERLKTSPSHVKDWHLPSYG